MANNYNYLDGTGKEQNQSGTNASTGVAQAGEIIAANNQGFIDETWLPPGAGPDIKTLEASEALSGGQYVNIFNDGGTMKVRLADSTNGREANGFVKDTFASGAQAQIYSNVSNTALSGLTLGADYFLGAAGNPTTVVPSHPTDTINQYLGTATATDCLTWEVTRCIGLNA